MSDYSEGYAEIIKESKERLAELIALGHSLEEAQEILGIPDYRMKDVLRDAEFQQMLLYEVHQQHKLVSYRLNRLATKTYKRMLDYIDTAPVGDAKAAQLSFDIFKFYLDTNCEVPANSKLVAKGIDDKVFAAMGLQRPGQ